MTMRDTALALQQELLNPDAEVEDIRDLADKLVGDSLRLAHLMSEPDWGVGMLEDIAAVTGKDQNPRGLPVWSRH